MTFFRFKRSALLLAALVPLALLWPLIAGAEKPAEPLLPPPHAHVNDFADVIDTQTEERLNAVLENYKQRTGIDFVIATVKSAGNRDLFDYSVQVTDEWDVGLRSSAKKSLMMLIAADTAQFFTHTSSGADKDLPPGVVGYMGRRMRPQLQQHNYSGGLLTGIQAFVDIAGQAQNLTFETLDKTDRVSSVAAVARTKSIEPKTESKGVLKSSERSAKLIEMAPPAIATALPAPAPAPAPVKSPAANTVSPKTVVNPPAVTAAKDGPATTAATAVADNHQPEKNSKSTSNVTAPVTAKSEVRLLKGNGSAALDGQIIDTLNGLIVGAEVTISDSEGRQQTTITDAQGKYHINGLDPGTYVVRAVATGFEAYENARVEVASRRQVLDIKLEVTIGKQEVTVSADTGLGSSMNMRVLSGKDLTALPTGPGGLTAALRALAVPATGPAGPQILVNGFSDGRIPPKESIREIRISENPFSSEYPQLGFGRIEILTKPGTEKFQGSAFFNFNDEGLNSRNPFALNRAAFQSRIYGGSVSGPIVAKRLSFFADFERQEFENNALINATVLDPALNIVGFNQTIITPQTRTSFSPRVEFQVNKTNTLVGRYSYSTGGLKNAGVGDFSLLSRAYDTRNSEQLLQLTETAVLSPTVINETRFQFLRHGRRERGNNSIFTTLVPEAFTDSWFCLK